MKITEKQTTECPCCHAELEVYFVNESIIAVLVKEDCEEKCDHNWIPYVSDKFFSKCSKCGQIKNE